MTDRTYMLPLDAFIHVLFLFLLQHDLDEQLLKLLVAVVNAELFETDTPHIVFLRHQQLEQNSFSGPSFTIKSLLQL